jgi:uncharacterized protein YprB with RNaseH-like and TPR domain
MVMRDLASRLRAIVGKRPHVSFSELRENDTRGRFPARELVYVPDIGAEGIDLDATAAALGGSRYDVNGSACVVVDRVWSADQWHGRRQVESYAIDPAAPIGLFDSRLGAERDWASHVVFFDIETTGLSGGAGTLAFLAGCGWFEDGGFKVRQFFLSGPGGEHALLDALSRIFDDASLLVTFNGRTFDVPVMDTRWAYHRRDTPTADLPHFDMLPPARRLWKRPGDGARSPKGSPVPLDDHGCTLSALERSVLRFHRPRDVPGFEIPSRYFYFLRTGHVAAIEGVLEHNRHDVISLAAVMSQALRLAADGPEACETAAEQLGLGRLYERAGDLPRASQAFTLAAASPSREVAAHAMARLAVLLRREARYEEAAAAWQGVLVCAAQTQLPLSTLERHAVEALAVHHEHRARDFATAKRYAETLRAQARGPLAAAADHRLGRLDRKIRARVKSVGELLD